MKLLMKKDVKEAIERLATLNYMATRLAGAAYRTEHKRYIAAIKEIGAEADRIAEIIGGTQAKLNMYHLCCTKQKEDDDRLVENRRKYHEENQI